MIMLFVNPNPTPHYQLRWKNQVRRLFPRPVGEAKAALVSESVLPELQAALEREDVTLNDLQAIVNAGDPDVAAATIQDDPPEPDPPSGFDSNPDFDTEE